MLKKPITFENLDGDEITEIFYFHMNETELTKLRMKYEAKGGMQEYFAGIVKARDVQAIVDVFDDLVLGSVGLRSNDGKRFEKRNGQVAEEFKETDAYSVLFQELIEGDGRNFQAFVQSVVPNRSRNRLAENLKEQEKLGNAAAKALNELPPTAPFADIPHNPPSVPNKATEAAKPRLSDTMRELHDDTPAFIKEGRPPTKEELLAMSPEQINKAFNKQQ